jgi:SAM-dependent methyltransferase
MTDLGWQDHFDKNRAKWNTLTPIHAASKSYDVESFKRGKCSLFHVERDEVGDVRGKKLLHLQCHFEMDTLSWARLGADVVGMDFAEEAIGLAERLATELDIPARFVCCNVYDLMEHLHEQFDVVFTSSGVLCWLPDLKKWAETAAHFVKPGGFFYMHEFHFAAEARKGDDYFACGQPTLYEGAGTYADPDAPVFTQGVEWRHTLGDIVTALIQAGLRLEYLHEWPHCVCPFSPDMKQGPDGGWYDGERPNRFPLMFSLRAWENRDP